MARSRWLVGICLDRGEDLGLEDRGIGLLVLGFPGTFCSYAVAILGRSLLSGGAADEVWLNHLRDFINETLIDDPVVNFGDRAWTSRMRVRVFRNSDHTERRHPKLGFLHDSLLKLLQQRACVCGVSELLEVSD